MAVNEQGFPCGRKARKGSIYCPKCENEEGIVTPKSKGRVDTMGYSSALDIFSAYTEGMSKEDVDFMIRVYGDWNLDTEISLLRLMINRLFQEGTVTQQLQNLPRIVETLHRTLQQAIAMVEGNRLVIDFDTAASRTYYKELFQHFSRFMEQTLADSFCDSCKSKLQMFLAGGEQMPDLEGVTYNE